MKAMKKDKASKSKVKTSMPKSSNGKEGLKAPMGQKGK